MKLYKHQSEALKRTKQFSNVAYFHDMGLGKTFTGSEKMVSLGTDTNLLICQKSKIDDWVNHFKSNYKMGVYNLTVKKEFDDYIMHDVGWSGYRGCTPSVGIINYELAWRRSDLLELKDGFTLMLDESSLIQNEKAKQTKFILKMKPANVILLSGTPCSGKYENLWSQMHLLGWDISKKLFDAHYVNFKKINVGGMVRKIPDKDDPYKNIERLRAKMREYGCDFIKTEEVFDLPEQVFTTVDVKTSKDYWKFIKNDYLQLKDGTEFIGDMVFKKHLAARQLCGSYSADKLQAFKDLVQSTQDRLIVFYNFNAELVELEAIANDLERPFSLVNGSCKRLDEYEQYDNSITFVQYQAGAKGLNLQKANKIIYFTPTERVEDWMQSQKRIHRIGQNQTCFYYLLTCTGSIDEKIYESLKRGVNFTDELFEENC